MKKSAKSKKPSGAVFRKRRRARALKAVVNGELVRFRMKHRPKCLDDYRTLMSRITYALANGELPEFLATKLSYVASVGAAMEKERETVRALREMQQQLERINGAPLLTNGRKVFESSAYVTSNETQE